MTITHIIFDLSEVLIRGLVGIDNEVGKLIGNQSDNLLRKFGGEDLRALCRNEIIEDDYLKKIITKEKWSCSPDELKRVIRNNFHHIIGEMDELVAELSKKYSLILLSDHAKEWINYIEGYHDFLNHFSYRKYSFDTGHLKYEIHNFKILLNDLNIPSSSCLFIDDRKENIETAQQCGIKGILFKDQDQLIKELARYGVFL
ncbi:MAG: hypothetical protein B1H05_02385 [Candidatus Cloacimonas sp. 4484_140]|nr:MAG: hypothetical protein B1H05_02385 [Candidatus Cloacimonas sp. 4484_140]